MAAYDNINKVLELMKKKKEPVKSRRKIDKKSKKKLDVEQFLPKERSKTVSDEIINSRRIKKALDAEYARVQGKSNSLDSKAREALKKLVTKSTGDIIEEQRKLDILNSKKVKSDTQQLLEYFENKSTPEELLNRVPEYVDADAAVKKEIRSLIKLGGYRDLAKQKSIVKKFMGGTALQRQELIDDIAATPKAQDMKKAMREEATRAKAEALLLENIEKLAKKKIADDKAAEKLADKTERALEKATEKADKAAEKATEKAEREAEKLALMAPALLIKQKKADAKAAAILAKASKGTAVTPAEQKILDAKVARDLAAQKVLDDKAEETPRRLRQGKRQQDLLAGKRVVLGPGEGVLHRRG